jgi:putative DNA primase/helicase
VTRTLALTSAAVSAGRSNGAAASPSSDNSDQSPKAGKERGSDKRRRQPQRNVLIGLTDDCELWHDANRSAFVSFPVGEHREHWAVRSRAFKMWLSGRFYGKTGGAVGGQALEDGIRILEARAVIAGPQYEPFIRVGHRGGKLYLDLCDAQWRAVEVAANTWRVIETPPIKMLRSPSMRPLPEPECGSVIEELRSFLNVRDDEDFMLVVAWLVAALRPRGPYPILVANGEQGSGKSVFCRMLRLLVDPGAAPIRAAPKDDRDLVVSAGNSWILAFDNLSSVPGWLSDAFCRLATGGGFATRRLHTDHEEMIFEAQRPVLLNGIPLLADRADLADRAVTIHLCAIREEDRLPEDALWEQFEQARPRILGALLDAVSAALRHLSAVRIDRPPRMADFVKWITAAAPGLGWDDGAFLTAYREGRIRAALTRRGPAASIGSRAESCACWAFAPRRSALTRSRR